MWRAQDILEFPKLVHVIYRLSTGTGNPTHQNMIILVYRSRSSAQFSGYTKDFQVAWANIPEVSIPARFTY